MQMQQITRQLTEALGQVPDAVSPLTGGCVGEVYAVRLADGTRLVAKVDDGPTPRLDVEGFMLAHLAEQTALPVPVVHFVAPRLLVMSFLPGRSHFPAGAQAHAAELLAALHNLSAPQFGLARGTLIGGLPQPNPWTDRWLAFFRDWRLLYMAEEAARAGRLPEAYLARLARLGAQLDRWLVEPARPGLVHGDVWTSNVLAAGERITGFLDPAIYYADPEIELTFITLFGTFGDAFFARYHELRPIRPGFFEARRDLYNLYPLLVHVRLFGGGYVASVDRTLRRFGF